MTTPKRESGSLDVGHLRVDPVIDGIGRFEPTQSFRGTTPEQWEIHRSLLDVDGKLGFAMGGFLVRDGIRTVLVDLGVGQARMMGIDGGQMLDSLRALGVEPDDVTDVVFTHLHQDHIGWATQDGHAVFGAATYRCAAADWQHFGVDHPGDVAEHLAPVVDRLETWVGDDAILPGIDALAAPGHTPGSTVIVLSSGAQRAMLLGDVVHCPVQLLDDEWGALFDLDPELAQRTRVALARELERSAIPAAAAHFDHLQFGRLIEASGRRQWVL